jgi:hypothetical protein
MNEVLEQYAALLEQEGGEQAMISRMRHFQRDHLFARRHFDEWSAARPNSYIAIWDEEVVAWDEELDAVLGTLRRLDIDPGQAYVQYLPAPGTLYIL